MIKMKNNLNINSNNIFKLKNEQVQDNLEAITPSK